MHKRASLSKPVGFLRSAPPLLGAVQAKGLLMLPARRRGESAVLLGVWHEVGGLAAQTC